ncbi:redoxin domain-containing protein [Halobium salinum]|uniref:Redoxin domain-containing protein n=1 Tax=Halobium salinum TaxID=1364940 RepID=A0ABD5P9N9_9EURY|nr:redoxin domain-containing protein [Halobium salinum]
MLDVGDTAPEFTVPMATPEHAGDAGAYTSDHVERFDLGEALEDGPVALAFFPGVFSRTCTQELCEMRDWHGEMAELGGSAGGADDTAARVYGVSVDTPWSQLRFVDEYDLDYPLLSGFNSDLVADYGVRREDGILRGIAKRAVYVVAPDRTVAYAWLTEESLTFPDLDAVAEAMAASARGDESAHGDRDD